MPFLALYIILYTCSLIVGEATRVGAVPHFVSPSAGKILPSYSDVSSQLASRGSAVVQGTAVAGFSFGQKVRNTAAQPPKISAPLPMSFVAGDLRSAVNNLAKLAEPSAEVGRSEAAGAGSGDMAAQHSSEATLLKVESTSAGSPATLSASVTVAATGTDALAAPDVVGAAALHLPQKPISASSIVSPISPAGLTVASVPVSAQSGFTPSAVPISPVKTLGSGFVFGQQQPSFTDTPSKPLHSPTMDEQHTVTTDTTAAITTGSVVPAEETSTSVIQPVSSPLQISFAVSAATSVQSPASPVSAVDPAQSTLTTLFGQSVVSSAVTSSPEPAAVFVQPSTATITDVSGASTATSVTTSELPPSTVSGATPATVFGHLSTTPTPTAPSTGVFVAPASATSTTSSEQPPLSSFVATTGGSTAIPATVFGQPAMATSTTGSTAFGGGPSPTSSAPPSVFGISATTITSTTTAAGMTVFAQQQQPVLPSSSSTLFGGQTTSSATSALSSVNIFGQPAVATTSSAAGSGIFGVFGQPSSSAATTTSAPSSGTFPVFGQPSSTAADVGGFKPFGFGALSAPGFGQTPTFGQSTFGQSAFGQTTAGSR